MNGRHILFSLLAALLLGALVACGGGTGSEGPSGGTAFTVTSTSSDIAERGETVTINGSGLAGVTVFLAGMEIVPDTQTAAKITFTVPGVAPSGPQELVVRSGDKKSEHPLFVGIDFPSGSLENLVALNLPTGTAVRLAATTYTSASDVELDGISLYGAGRTATTVVLPALGGGTLFLVVDSTSDTTIQDLTIRFGALAIVERGPGGIIATSVESAAGATLFSKPDIELASLVDIAGVNYGTLTFQNVYLTNLSSLESAVLITSATAGALPVVVRFIQSEFSGESTGLVVGAAGIEFTDSGIDVSGAMLLSIAEPLIGRNSRIASGGTFGAELEIVALNGADFDNVTVESTTTINFDTAVFETDDHEPFEYAINTVLPVRSQVSVKNSSFIIPAPTGGITEDQAVEIKLALVDADFDNVDFNIAGDMSVLHTGGSQTTFTDSRFVIGDANFPAADVDLEFNMNIFNNGNLKVDTSQITFQSRGEIHLTVLDEGQAERFGRFQFNSNNVTGRNGQSLVGLNMVFKKMESDFIVEMLGNTYKQFGRAFNITIDSADTNPGFVDGEIHDNQFNFDTTDTDSVALLDNVHLGNAFFDASNNTWEGNTTAAQVRDNIGIINGASKDAFDVDPIR